MPRPVIAGLPRPAIMPSTSTGSKCEPRPAAMWASASSGRKPCRYERSEVIASHTSASAVTRAMYGMSFPASLVGYPVPSQRS